MTELILWMFTKKQLQILRLRIFLPFAGITVFIQGKCRVSERHCEDCRYKDFSEVSTGIGDHESKYNGGESEDAKGDEQFEIDDSRSLDVMYKDIAGESFHRL